YLLGHPLQPPVGFLDQLNHYQEGDGPSYCYAILILEFTPSYQTLLAKRRDGEQRTQVKQRSFPFSFPKPVISGKDKIEAPSETRFRRGFSLEPATGLEPVTSSLPWKRSTC